MARGAELPGVALTAQHREQIFEGIAQPLAVIVSEAVDLAQEAAQRFGITIGQVGVAEDRAEQLGQLGILHHPGQRLGIGVEHFLPADARRNQLGPSITLELAGEELAGKAHLLGLKVHVVHELVD